MKIEINQCKGMEGCYCSKCVNKILKERMDKSEKSKDFCV